MAGVGAGWASRFWLRLLRHALGLAHHDAPRDSLDAFLGPTAVTRFSSWAVGLCGGRDPSLSTALGLHPPTRGQQLKRATFHLSVMCQS